MSTWLALILAFLAGMVLGIIEMAILAGHVDKWLDRRQKKNR